MKKLRILIPSLVTVSSLPIIMTACSTQEHWTAQWDIKDGEFVWQHGQPSSHYDTMDDLADGYFQQIDEDILADDLMCFTTNELVKVKDEVELAHMKVRINKIDKVNHRVSFDLDEKLLWKKGLQKPGYGVDGTSRASFCNCPFTIDDEETVISKWSVHTDYCNKITDDNWQLFPWYSEHKDWSFSINYHSGDKDISGTIDYKKIKEVDPMVQTIINSMCRIHFPSYFFEKTTVGESR